MLGDNIGFWIGVKGGYRLARRYGPKLRLGERKLKVARYLTDRHGAKRACFGRFVSVLHTYAAFLVGVTRMRWPRFALANAADGIVWAAVYTAVGYLAGRTLQRLSLTIDLVIGGIAVLLIILAVVPLRRRMARLTEQAEEAYPGPLD